MWQEARPSWPFGRIALVVGSCGPNQLIGVRYLRSIGGRADDGLSQAVHLEAFCVHPSQPESEHLTEGATYRDGAGGYRRQRLGESAIRRVGQPPYLNSFWSEDRDYAHQLSGCL